MTDNQQNIAAMPSRIAAILAPRERLAMSEWAVRNFVIAEKGAILPGPYSLDMTPYWREPMDAMGDPAVRHINIVASAQVGKTQIGNVCIAWHASERPSNMLYVRPTEPDVVEAFRDRFRPMIEANLRHLTAGANWMNLSDNPVISLTSCIIYGAAASIARHLTSRTTPIVIFDETDTAEETSNSLGNVLALLDERQMAGSAMRSLTVGMSTPKFEDGSNYAAYVNLSDRREYWEPCPICGHYQPLRMDAIKSADGERDPMLIRRHSLARYECRGCRELIGPDWQGWMADRGVWVPHGREIAEPLPVGDADVVDRALAILPDRERWTPPMTGEDADNPHRGYRVWRANTKFEQCGWSHILARFFETHKKPELFQVFVNNWLAEAWRHGVAAADAETLRARVGVYEPRMVPSRAKVVLGAVDVQQDALWYLLRAFGPNQESWLIDKGHVEVSHQNYRAALQWVYDHAITRGFQVAGEPTAMMRAWAIAADSGYRADEVYEFARQPCVIAVKGHDIADYRLRVSQVEGKHRPDPLPLYHVNTKVFKDRLQRMIHAMPGDAGEFHLHRDTTEEYVEHMTSEHLIAKKGVKVKTWQLKSESKANHWLDCETYVLALAEALEQRLEIRVMSLQDTDPRYGSFLRGADPLGAPPTRRKPRRGRHAGWAADKPAWVDR